MKKIPKIFQKNGFNYVLEKRKDKIAIYKQMKEDVLYGWEVHKIRIAKPSVMKIGNKVKEFPLREILAYNEDFGQYGWAFQNKDSAIKKFQELSSTNIFPVNLP